MRWINWLLKWHLGHRLFHSSFWGRISETVALAQTFTIEPRPRHWQNYMFVFNPRWDMHSLRAKEIKDSPNSQAVPKILVYKKWLCLVPHWLRFLLFLQYSLAWLVSPSWLYQMLWDSPKFRTKENQRQPDFTSSPNTLIHWYHCDSDLYICLCPFPEG